MRFNEKLAEINYSAFVDCSGFSGVLVIPKNVTLIGRAAFVGCNGISEVVVDQENKVYTSKGNCIIQKSNKMLVQAFSCSEIPQDDSIVCLENYALSRISGRDIDFSLPKGVTEISLRAFYRCYALKNITIFSVVTSIGKDAFLEATNLELVIMQRVVPPTLGAGVFDNTNNCPIYVPADSVQAYKTANGWSAYADRIFAIV